MTIATVPNAITIVIDDAPVLKEKKIEIDVKIFVAQSGTTNTARRCVLS
jgi:hypothetical protein